MGTKQQKGDWGFGEDFEVNCELVDENQLFSSLKGSFTMRWEDEHE